VIDENEKAIWKQGEHLGDGICEYQSGSFVIASPAPRLVWMLTPVGLDNFAYQVLVTGGAYPLGLVFRANRAHTSYYLLVKESIWLKLYLIDGNRGRELHQFHSDDRQWYAYDNRAYKSRPVLLGIVAQGATIDVYENLTHLGSTRDESQSTGEIGLFVAKNGMFSHTKVWQKH
jgi:hypothetical protein